MVIRSTNGSHSLELSMSELKIIHQALNEVCNGFKIDDFEKTIGFSRESVVSEMDRLKKIYAEAVRENDRESVDVRVAPNQLQIYRSALQEACREIDEWEFDSRFDSVKSEALGLLSQLGPATGAPLA